MGASLSLPIFLVPSLMFILFLKLQLLRAIHCLCLQGKFCLLIPPCACKRLRLKLQPHASDGPSLLSTGRGAPRPTSEDKDQWTKSSSFSPATQAGFSMILSRNKNTLPKQTFFFFKAKKHGCLIMVVWSTNTHFFATPADRHRGSHAVMLSPRATVFLYAPAALNSQPLSGWGPCGTVQIQWV